MWIKRLERNLDYKEKGLAGPNQRSGPGRYLLSATQDKHQVTYTVDLLQGGPKKKRS